jgi:hypothetical protein
MQAFLRATIIACVALVFSTACSDSKKQAPTPVAKASAAPLDPACDPSYTAEQCTALVELLNTIKALPCNPANTAQQCAQLNEGLKKDAIQLVADQIAERKRLEVIVSRVESGQPTPQDMTGIPDECKLQIQTMQALRGVLNNPADESVSKAARAFVALDIAQLKPVLYAQCGYVPSLASEEVRQKDCQLYRRATVALRGMQRATPKDVHSPEESNAIPAKIIALEQAVTAECGTPQAAAQAKKDTMSKGEAARQNATISADCAQQTQNLAAMKRMLSPAPGEIISESEREALPSEIASVEKYIATNCK